MWKLLRKLKDLVFYNADREFYAKVFPGSVKTKDLLRIRQMDTGDLPAVLEIEVQNYEFPWPEEIFKDCLRTMTYTNWVLEAPDDVIVGYCIISVAACEAHIMNLSVNPLHQHQGAGRKMLEHMIEYARSRAECIFLEVRPSNPRALKIYKKFGFHEIGVRKAYYPATNGREDAIMLELELVPML
ncbi:MAG: ribosomal protein S18-alanine N-acetyltransferase [Methylococcales bacterium]|nr:ribosomal protein S18-alanine N-acetyltransferase [Methylococcales bacterium]